MHKDGTTVAENRHGLRGKGQIGVLLNAQSKAFRCGLQEISIAGRALGVEFEIFDAAVVQNDDFDVLPTHVDNDMRIFIELERRFRMRHGLDQRYVRVQNVFQNILRVARSGYSEHLQLRLLRFDLSAQVFEHFDGVLNRVSVGELVRLTKNVAFFVEQHGLG